MTVTEDNKIISKKQWLNTR